MVHELSANDPEMSIKENFDLQIFCRKAEKKTPIYFFRSATVCKFQFDKLYLAMYTY